MYSFMVCGKKKKILWIDVRKDKELIFNFFLSLNDSI